MGLMKFLSLNRLKQTEQDPLWVIRDTVRSLEVQQHLSTTTKPA